jgi:glutamyl-tRNA synthetase
MQQLILRVTVEVKGRETEGVDVQTKPLHKKDAAIGNKQLVYSSNLIMEQEDAASFGDNEEVSLHTSYVGRN